MKTVSIVLLFVSIFFVACKPSQKEEKPATKEIKIGNQIWMTENLNVDHFRNGDPIPEAKTSKDFVLAGEAHQPAWCYYDYDSANGAKYGKLYNWYAVNELRVLAPKGWHVPSKDEWTILSNYLNEDLEVVGGIKMKSKSGWKDNGNGSNESGFSGLPGGSHLGKFSFIGVSGMWWSSTESSNNSAWCLGLNGNDDFILSGLYSSKDYGLSVRCVKD